MKMAHSHTQNWIFFSLRSPASATLSSYASASQIYSKTLSKIQDNLQYVQVYIRSETICIVVTTSHTTKTWLTTVIQFAIQQYMATYLANKLAEKYLCSSILCVLRNVKFSVLSAFFVCIIFPSFLFIAVKKSALRIFFQKINMLSSILLDFLFGFCYHIIFMCHTARCCDMVQPFAFISMIHFLSVFCKS